MRRRQIQPLRVVNQIKRQRRVTSETGLIQSLQALDAFLVNPLAALRIDIILQVTGHGSNHFHLLLRQKIHQPGITGLDHNRQVAAVNHMDAMLPGSGDQMFERGVHFRRAASEIQRGDGLLQHEIDYRLHSLLIHDFGAARTGVNMTVQTLLVTKIPQVDLQGLQLVAPNGGKIGVAQQWQSVFHNRRFSR